MVLIPTICLPRKKTRFGSLPYHGISNSQVVEYVKAGNQLCLSEAIPEDLRELLSQCWDWNPRQRPSIKEIVATLEESPELISPYLEAPVASVPVEGAGSLELMAIPWAADRAAPPPAAAPPPQQPHPPQQPPPPRSSFPPGGTEKRGAKATKSCSSFTSEGPGRGHPPRSPLARNFSHPSTTSTTTHSQDHAGSEAPSSLESPHPKLSLEKSGRFFLRSNSEEVSDSYSPPPTPTAHLTSFFTSAVHSAAQALRKQPYKANGLRFSPTPSPSPSALPTPMTGTPTKHALLPLAPAPAPAVPPEQPGRRPPDILSPDFGDEGDGFLFENSRPSDSLVMRTMHYGTKPGHFETSKIHFPTSEVSERANE